MLNFFDPTCQEPPISNGTFGLCDDQKGGKAYTKLADPDTWVATVVNKNNKEVTFTAIDKCVIKDHQETGRGRCDGMLTGNSFLYLLELKDGQKATPAQMISQLESTIKFLITNHNLTGITHKKAYGSNKKKGTFQEVDNEQNLSFFRKYGFRIDIQASIVII